jgi:hypothetical protein
MSGENGDAFRRFIPATIDRVPKPTQQELSQVFRDIDADKTGSVTSKCEHCYRGWEHKHHHTAMLNKY